jgi:hypothetical protein
MALRSGTREGRKSSRQCFGRASDQPTLLGQRRACEALGSTARCYRRVRDHQARAIRLKDAGRRQNPAMAGDFPTIHLSATTGRKEMINELDRLMTITDLSEMLGVPVDTLYGWRHRG